MNFDKYYDTYDTESYAQNIVANHLTTLINKHKKSFAVPIDTAFEIGCGTGIFTRLYHPYLKPQKLILNDIFDTRRFLQNINHHDFVKADIESLSIPNADIYLSSSALQWIKNLPDLLKKVSHHTNTFCFSLYIDGNLKEIKKPFWSLAPLLYPRRN